MSSPHDVTRSIDPAETGELSLFLAGDAILVRPWSKTADPAFLALIEEVRGADVAIANLETVVHEFKGYAQADSGGCYLTSPPEIASELRWAGFDMVAHANNHSFDYGSSGILETVEHVKKAGIAIAGSGSDLVEARAPRYAITNGSRVALVAMASDFVPYGKASSPRGNSPGRPGLNPLTVYKEKRVTVPGFAHRGLRFVSRQLKRLRRKPLGEKGVLLKAGQFDVVAGRGFRVVKEWVVVATELAGNLAAVTEARTRADVVVVSIHAHRQGRWLRDFALRAFAVGADVVFVHGPHRPRPIEIVDGKPIIYSLGDFAFEVEAVTRLPSESYDRYRLGDDAAPADYHLASSRSEGLLDDPSVFAGMAAKLIFRGGRPVRLQLIPVDLHFDGPAEARGRPSLASPDLGRRIIEAVAKASAPFGTEIRYNPANNRGEVALP